VLTDRINVGGNESGQQSLYVGPGSGGDQAVWSLDGMVITDMSATGSSPGYFDFDAFEEMQVTTGGSDASIATGGVVLNMVTKRGTNEWRGSARYFYTDDNLQGDLDLDTGELGKPGPWNNNRTQGPFNQGKPRFQDPGLRLRARRSDRQGQAVDLGLLFEARDQPADDQQLLRQDDARGHERQGELADRAGELAHRRLLEQRQGEAGTQRRSDPAPGDDLRPGQVRTEPDGLQARGHAHLLLELLPHGPLLQGERRLRARGRGRRSAVLSRIRRGPGTTASS
jgi:hypothetical protein